MVEGEGRERYGRIDESELVFRQISLIQRTLSGDLKSFEEDDDIKGNIWAARFAAAVSGLEALLNPILSEEYQENWGSRSGENRPEDKVEYHTRRWKALIQEIADHGIAFEAGDEYVIDEEAKAR